jgi:chromosome segregation ATPase
MTTNYAKVKELCDNLVANNVAVSLEKILPECEGSTANILAHYQRWRSESQDTRQTPADIANLSEEYLAAFHREIKRFSNTINRDFELQLERTSESEKFAIHSLQKSEKLTTELHDKIASLEIRLDDESLQHKQIIAQIEDNADAEIAKLKVELNSQHQQLTDAKNKALEEICVANESTIEQINTANDATIAELKESFAITIEELKHSGESRVSELTENVANQVNALESALHDKDIQIQNVLKEKNTALSQLSQLQQTAHSNAEKVQKQSSQYENLIKEKEQMQAHVQQANQNIDLIKKQNVELTQFKQEQQEAVKEAKSQIEEMSKQLHAAQKVANQFEGEKENLIKQMDFVKHNSSSTIERLTQSSDHNIAKVRLLEERLEKEQNNAWRFESDNEKIKEQLEFIKQNSATTVERLTRSAEKAMAKVRDLERDLDDSKLEIEQLKSSNNVVHMQGQA